MNLDLIRVRLSAMLRGEHAKQAMTKADSPGGTLAADHGFLPHFARRIPGLGDSPGAMARLFLTALIIAGIWAAKGWRKKLFGRLSSKLYDRSGLCGLSLSRNRRRARF